MTETSTRRERQREATYAEIVRASRELLAEGAELSLRAVATRMGVTAPALYRYVASYQDLVDLVAYEIDRAATETFAADVTHELKNPLASLRSAVDTLATVKDPALQDRLLGVVRDDVGRLDRLIVDIAEASRVDAELSRAKFERIDVGTLVGDLVPIVFLVLALGVTVYDVGKWLSIW